MISSSVLQLGLFASGLAVGVGVTSALTSVVKKLALSKNLVDSPNHRSVHKNPIPRVGGVAIFGGFLAGLAYFFLIRLMFPESDWIIDFPNMWVLAGALIMFTVGLIDDFKNLKPTTKLFFQALCAFMVVAAGYRFEVPFLNFPELGVFNDLLTAGFTFIWILGIINAVNLMDGMDGLAAGMSVIAVSCLTIALALNGYGADLVLVTAFIGALLGFLMHNTHPATIFMGDSGSLFLGFILATFSLPATGAPIGSLPYLVPILALGLPIMDTLTAIIRRGATGKGIFKADADHIHHRLFKKHGNEQSSTVMTLYAVNLIFGVMAIFVISSKAFAQVAVVLCLLLAFVLIFLRKLGYIQLRNKGESESQ